MGVASEFAMSLSAHRSRRNSSMDVAGADLSVPQGSCRAEQPLEGFAEVSYCPATCPCEISLGVFHGARENVQLVVERIEFRSGDDQLVVTELQFGCALTGHPIPLTASLRAELPWPSGSSLLGQMSPAPTAVRRPRPLSRGEVCAEFRHDESVADQLGAQDGPVFPMIWNTGRQ